MSDEKDFIIKQQCRIIKEQQMQIEELNKLVAELQATIKTLREQLNKNSGNSSKPPSTDGFKKVINKNQSLRKNTGKKAGGQKGHKGSCLIVPAEPNNTEEHPHADCKFCPHYEECHETAIVKETRYVIDAVVKVDITAHSVLSIEKCMINGREKTGSFPNAVKSHIQYGKNLEALAVTLNTVGAVSVNRTHEILSGVFNIPISTGTISDMVSRCSDKIKYPLDIIVSKLKESSIAHADETGMNINGKLNWAHSVSNDKYTYITLHTKRGYDAIKDIGILLEYKGTLVHDCWSAYWKLDGISHQLCCAHLLRELNGIAENNPEQKWVLKFKEFLLKMKKAVSKAIESNKEALSNSTLSRYSKMYAEIIKLAYEENPEPEVKQKQRGRRKRGKILSLIDRLFEHKGEVCLFLHNFKVPFDNNQAERDIRNIKIKTKVSGFFKTEEGAKNYLNIMSFVGTAKKHGYSAYEAIRLAVIGNPETIFGCTE